MSICNSTCPGYENDGVCNVPQPCQIGSDCDDCGTRFPMMPLILVILSGGISMVMLFNLLCIHVRRRHIKMHGQSRLITPVNQTIPSDAAS